MASLPRSRWNGVKMRLPACNTCWAFFSTIDKIWILSIHLYLKMLDRSQGTKRLIDGGRMMMMKNQEGRIKLANESLIEKNEQECGLVR